MPIHTYSSWNIRLSDQDNQREPYRKYYFICEGANTETYYFRRLIDRRRELGIHPLIEICLCEKTEEDRDISFPRKLLVFANQQKQEMISKDEFDRDRDRMILVFDGDIFEEKVQGYEDLIEDIEHENNIAAVSNPGFELYLILHFKNAYHLYIQGNEDKFLQMDEKRRYSYAYHTLHGLTKMNAKTNKDIGLLADHVLTAIEEEKKINQDIHNLKGNVSCNIGAIIESILNEDPDSDE